MNSKVENLPPHVLLFPFPAHSHVHSLLKLAELLCHGGLRVTFLVADQTHSHLVNDTAVRSHFDRYSGRFRFQNLHDGLLPKDRIVPEFPISFLEAAKPRFEDVLVAGKTSITCIIVDVMMLSFAVDVAGQIGVPIMCHPNSCPSDLWAVRCVPKLTEAGEIPFQGGDLDVLIENIPGFKGLIRRRDLSSFLRAGDLSDKDFQYIANGACQAHRVRMILNTFEELEGPALAQIRSRCPGIYAVGPFHEHLKTKLAPTIPSNNLKKEDMSCIAWLDEQPLRSVIYVSFGSIAVMSNDQLLELWHGLKNSGKSFLWVLPSVADKEWKNQLPPELLIEDASGKGNIVAWAPQEEVLAHKAVGGFLTHSGWNSTLESMVAGVPMICWPFFGDQLFISRLVAEVWKLGLDMKDTCDRAVIEKMVKEVMETRREEFMQAADQMAKLAKNTVCKGGSSYSNLDRLIDDIRSLDNDSKEGKKEILL